MKCALRRLKKAISMNGAHDVSVVIQEIEQRIQCVVELSEAAQEASGDSIISLSEPVLYRLQNKTNDL